MFFLRLQTSGLLHFSDKMEKKRRLAHISDDEEEVGFEIVAEKMKKMKTRGGGGAIVEEEEEEAVKKRGSKADGGKGNEKERDVDAEGEEQKEEEIPVPIGDVVRVSGKGKKRKRHYNAFEYNDNQYELEDSVLLTGEDLTQKPYVAIIKDITQGTDGNMMVTGQWFYRPEEAEMKGGGNWPLNDSRELFYSFHLDDVPAESVMHRCVVHFVPLNKQLPVRSQHPGFFVQRVYDTVEKKLWKLTDKDYKEHNQLEIDLLVQKTRERLGELPEIEVVEPSADQQEQQKSTWNLRRKHFIVDVDVSRNYESSTKSDGNLRLETPGSCNSDASECYIILSNFKALTGDSPRDKWLEKLVSGIRFICNVKDSASTENKAAFNGDSNKISESVNCSQDKNCGKIFYWPDDVIPAITSMEKVAYETLGSDFMKYNQKMRQLDFNLKNNQLLARRLLNKELEPSVILNMSPAELKDGLTAEEKTTKEPDRAERMQMTDARCSRCAEKKVGVADVIHAGSSGDRYQLECIACGHTWYASRDAISSLTIETATVRNVGTAPWATSKFEDVEKKLVSPRESDKPVGDVFQKKTAAYMPVLENQRSFNKVKAEDVQVSTANPS